MNQKPLMPIVFAAGLLIALSPCLEGQATVNRPPTESTHASASSGLEQEMAAHQLEMKSLSTRLDESFQAIANARDSKGYVKNKAVIKTHELNIKILRNAVRDHKLLLTDYEQQCGVNKKQQDAMIEHQQKMKSVLYDIDESFDTFEQSNDQPDNPNIDITMYIGPAFVAHRDALKELAGDISQHYQAMNELMTKCSQLPGA